MFHWLVKHRWAGIKWDYFHSFQKRSQISLLYEREVTSIADDIPSRKLKIQRITTKIRDQAQQMSLSSTLEATEISQAGGPSVEPEHGGEGHKCNSLKHIMPLTSRRTGKMYKSLLFRDSAEKRLFSAEIDEEIQTIKQNFATLNTESQIPQSITF